MQLETVDLLMMEGMRADDSFRSEEFSAGKPKTRICGQWRVFVEPGTNGALRDLAMISPAHDSLRLGEGVAEVEG